MINVTQQRIRLALDLSRWQQTPTDVITNDSPTIAASADLRFELAFSYGDLASDAQLVDTSNWASVTVALKRQADPDGLADWTTTLSALNFDNAMTFADWESGTTQNAVVAITAAQNNLFLPTGSTANTFQLVISALTSAASVTPTGTFGSGEVVMTVSSGSGIEVGQSVSGTNIAAGTTVTSVVGTSIGLSLATTGTSSGSYTFTTAARRVPIASFPVTVADTGLSADAPPTVAAPLYYTAAEADARYVQLGTDYTVFARLAGSTFTGAVVLASGQMSGATGLYATTKAYVDAADAAVAAAAVPVAGSTSVTGAKTFSALLTASAGVTVSGGSLTVGALAGVLKASAGVVSGSATTSDLTEGSNLYHTDARVRAAVLTGYAATSGTVAATDTVLQAIQKLGYAVANAFGGATLFQGATTATLTSSSTAKVGDLGFITGTKSAYVLTGNYATLGNWVAFPYPVSSVNSQTGAVTLTTDNIAEGSNLYFTNSRADGRVTAYTLGGSYTPGAGTVSSSDTILTAFQKVVGNINALSFASLSGATFTGAVRFSGTTNFGICANQLSTTQITALSTAGGNYGAIVYDTTANQLKALVNGSWVQLGAGSAYLPLSAGSGQPLTGDLYFQDGLAENIRFGANWNVRTSASNANFDFRNSTTVVLTLTSGNDVKTVGGYFDTPSSYGYRLNGTDFAYLSSTRAVVSWGGNWTASTTAAYADWALAYNGSNLLTVDQSGNAVVTGTVNAVGGLKVNGNTSIDTSGYFYDSSGNRLLAGRQSNVADFTAAGGWSDGTAYSDFGGLVSTVNSALAVLRAHGLM